MKALKRFTGVPIMVVAVALAAAACGTPTVTMTDGTQSHVITTEAESSGLSPTARVAAYCALEADAAGTLDVFRKDAPRWPSAELSGKALAFANVVSEVAPAAIEEALRVQRSALRQVDYAATYGTFDVMGYHRPSQRDATRTMAFAHAADAIAAFDGEVCGI